jgi:hypothetical protein
VRTSRCLRAFHIFAILEQHSRCNEDIKRIIHPPLDILLFLIIVIIRCLPRTLIPLVLLVVSLNQNLSHLLICRLLLLQHNISHLYAQSLQPSLPPWLRASRTLSTHSRSKLIVTYLIVRAALPRINLQVTLRSSLIL